MAEGIRWRYRFDNFSRACSLLGAALANDIDAMSRLGQEGVIWQFDHTFDLGWKVLKDRLEYDGVVIDLVSAREVIREAAASGLIADGQAWMDMLEGQGNAARSYDGDVLGRELRNIKDKYAPALDGLCRRFDVGGAGMMAAALPVITLEITTLDRMRRVFAGYPDLAEVRLFGSYATGRATPRSDIDLATVGIADRRRVGRLALDLEDLPIPQKCDVQAYERISYAPLKRHIDERGVTIYRKGDDGG